jgi:DNA-nicking Smr family endonuclease
MDAKAFGRLTRGKLAPQARIDLHGMTLAEAQPRLTGFVLGAQAQGLRLVLVITGKGRRVADDGPIPHRHGVLRHQVPIWLAQGPLAPAVLQVAEAHQRHGGGGAFYVYLRRPR